MTEPSRGPVIATRAEVEAVLVKNLSKILGSGVTPRALKSPGAMTIEDVHPNLHLYERLQVAAAALGALRGYDERPRGFALQEESK